MIYMVSGKAGAGKDTAFKIIRDSFPDYTVERFAFADSLKAYAKLIGWDGNKDDKGRKLLQDIGNSVRDYNEDTWATTVAHKIINSYSQIKIITDWRFPNEFYVLNKVFSPIVTINIVGRAYDLGNNSNNISEHALESFSFDYIIDNSGSIKDFKSKLCDMVEVTY